jgi:hypothetical protein
MFSILIGPIWGIEVPVSPENSLEKGKTFSTFGDHSMDQAATHKAYAK